MPGMKALPADLSQSIRTRVVTSLLPRDPRTVVYSGRAHGLSFCGCCGEPIPHSDTQHDVEQLAGAGFSSLIAMHAGCFRIWRDVVEALYLLDREAGVVRVPVERSIPAS
jgi:hypothetical protein